MASTRPPLRKYAPLTAYLVAQPPDVSEVTLTLPEIEAIIGAPLPAQARTVRWWNSGLAARHPQAWLAVGWRVGRKALWMTPPAVTFVRSDTIA